MQDRLLKEKLRAFCLEAAHQLAFDAANGADVPHELVDAGSGDGAHQPLWCYRTLTGEFIRQQHASLTTLASYLPAAVAVQGLDSLDEWLLARGEQHVPTAQRSRAEATLRVFLAEVLGDSNTIEYDEASFQTAWTPFEAVTIAGLTHTLLAAPIHGMSLESPEIEIEAGMMLVSPDSMEAEGLPGDIFRGEGLPVVAAVVAVQDNRPETLAAARHRLRKLVCALRLFGDASPAMGGAARLQVERGPWQVMGLEGSGSARAELFVPVAHEAELKQFCGEISNRWPRGGEIAWALRRHEYGCDRMHHLDGLSDHLLALRALLEPEGPASGRLNDRLAALCAEPADRARLAERTARAAALERSVLGGLSNRETESDQLCHELEMHLRALLRDVVCGHLDSDLVTLADTILAEAAGVALPNQTRNRRGFGDPDGIARAA